jgi:hypothetical protein
MHGNAEQLAGRQRLHPTSRDALTSRRVDVPSRGSPAVGHKQLERPAQVRFCTTTRYGSRRRQPGTTG